MCCLLHAGADHGWFAASSDYYLEPIIPQIMNVYRHHSNTTCASSFLKFN